MTAPGDDDRQPALRYDQRPADRTPDPHRRPSAHADRAIATSSPRRGWKRHESCSCSAPTCQTSPRPSTSDGSEHWLLWRAGPAAGGDARYWACRSDDLTAQHTFRLYPDATGDGSGPSGRRHAKFRPWKEDLLGR